MQIRNIAIAISALAMLSAAAIASAASLSRADQEFMAMAAKTDMTEAHEGQLAQEQANRGDVKEFARTIVQDHTDSYHQLTDLAAKTGVSIPKGINTAHVQTIAQLVRLKGPTFDRQFAQEEITAHRRAIAAFKHEAQHGENPDVKAYANKMIPVLEKHLHLAEDLAKPARRS